MYHSSCHISSANFIHNDAYSHVSSFTYTILCHDVYHSSCHISSANFIHNDAYLSHHHMYVMMCITHIVTSHQQTSHPMTHTCLTIPHSLPLSILFCSLQGPTRSVPQRTVLSLLSHHRNARVARYALMLIIHHVS